MKRIKITKGYSVLVDDSDYDLVSKFKWFYTGGYAGRNVNVGFKKQKKVWMHRFILGTVDGLEVDHINHNGLDNRRSNMRECNRSQNMANARRRKLSKTGFIGVKKSTLGEKFEASIKFMGKYKYLGIFTNPKDAAIAYNKAALECQGEFAILNIV